MAVYVQLPLTPFFPYSMTLNPDVLCTLCKHLAPGTPVQGSYETVPGRDTRAPSA